jgi:hypothetical protein
LQSSQRSVCGLAPTLSGLIKKTNHKNANKMKTIVFKDYRSFMNREYKEVNGVSEVFATNNPDYDINNETNKYCWNCSGCSDCWNCSGCSRCSDCSSCSDCSDCSHCSVCSRCSDCSDCSRCSGCSDCWNCSDCSDCSGCSDCSRCSDCSDCSRCSRILTAQAIRNTKHQ